MKRILIVDDIEENLYLLRVLLEGHGYEVELAKNGSEAFSKALEKAPDMIISDILMPVMDGFTLCRKWKSDEGLKRVPFIFYTATYTDSRDEQLALDMGADAFIVKPAEPDEFLRQIEKILNSNKEWILSGPQEPKAGDETILKKYNETLIRKLEQKMLELERVNRELEAEISEKNKVEISLREREELFKNMFDQHAAVKIIIDPDTGNIVDANEAAAHFYGWPREHLRQMKIWEINTLPLEEVKKEMEKARSQKGISFEFHHKRADGSVRDVEVFSSKIEVKGKNLLYSIVHDITERKQVEKALQESEQRLSTIYDTVGDIIYNLAVESDENYRFISVNRAFFNVTGLSQEMIVGKLVNEVIPEPSLSMVLEKYRQAIKENSIIRWEETSDYPTGRLIADVSIAPVVNDKGRCTHLVGSVHDITERKRAEEELQKYRERLEERVQERTMEIQKINEKLKSRIEIQDALEEFLHESEMKYRIIANNTYDWEFWLGPDDQYKYVSPSCKKITGYDQREFLEDPALLKNIIHPDYAVIYDEHRSKSKDQKIGSMQFRIIKKDGTLCWIEQVCLPVYDNKGVFLGTRGSNRDITKRKEAEAQIMRLSDDAQKAREAAEAATRTKSEFLANMSHEIRTPMNAIIGMTYLMQKTELSSKQADFVNKIMISSRSLLGIINDILDFSKIEAGKLSIESISFNINDVINNIASVEAVRAQDKGLEFIISVGSSVPNWLVGDPLRIGQVLLNLVGNAIKFTEKGEVILSVNAISVEGRKALLRFSVEDKGIGISENDKKNLFTSFSQADSSITRKYGGTGLGLAISKRLVEMMGGEMGVESASGVGSTFYFQIGFEVDDKKSAPILILPERFRGMRVLVVDDNLLFQKVVQSCLENFSLDPATASTGEEAIAEIMNAQTEGRPFELIFMDWELPGVDGIMTLKHIREMKTIVKKPKVILMTGFGMEDVIKKAEESGFNAFLIKPVTESVLMDTIMEVFSEKPEKRKQYMHNAVDLPEGFDVIKGSHILLVEDNEINQDVGKNILKSERFRVTVADNGKKAVEKIKSSKFDAVLMDIQMPEMDGYEAARVIRKDNRFDSLPIIAMTAEAMGGVREKVIEAGMNDYITKPIDPRELFLILFRWIKPGNGKTSGVKKHKAGNGSISGAELPDSLSGMDVRSGLARMGNSSKNYIGLLVKFSENEANIINDIRKSLKADDMETVAHLVHNLKGVSGNIGATELQSSAIELESAIKGGNAEDVQRLMEKTNDAFNKLLSTISLIRSHQKTGASEKKKLKTAKKDIDFKKVDVILEKLKKSIRSYDAGSIDEFALLKKSFSGSDLQEKLTGIEKPLNRYDFQESLKALEDFIKVMNLKKKGVNRRLHRIM